MFFNIDELKNRLRLVEDDRIFLKEQAKKTKRINKKILVELNAKNINNQNVDKNAEEEKEMEKEKRQIKIETAQGNYIDIEETNKEGINQNRIIPEKCLNIEQLYSPQSSNNSRFLNINYNIKYKAFVEHLKSLNLPFKEFTLHIEKYIEIILHKHMQIYNCLKQIIEKEKKKNVKNCFFHSESMFNRSELEKIFFDCVSEVRKEFNKKRENRNNSPTKNSITNMFSTEKLMIFDRLISNETMIEKIHELLFPKNQELSFPSLDKYSNQSFSDKPDNKPHIIYQSKSQNRYRKKPNHSLLIKGGKLKMISFNQYDLDSPN